MTKCVSMKVKLEPGDIRDGDYPGVWGGYRVTATIQEREVFFETEDGVRGMNTPCVVKIRDGKATAEVVK